MSGENGERVLNSMRLEILSVPENVSLARVAVASFAAQEDLTLSELEEIRVAVSEAVTNAIIHGYGRAPNALVRVIASRFKDRLEITVEDDGVGIADVEQAMQPAYSTDPERMGLGFVFMKSFMDRLEVDSSPGHGTRVLLVRNLGTAVPAVARQS